MFNKIWVEGSVHPNVLNTKGICVFVSETHLPFCYTAQTGMQPQIYCSQLISQSYQQLPIDFHGTLPRFIDYVPSAHCQFIATTEIDFLNDNVPNLIFQVFNSALIGTVTESINLAAGHSLLFSSTFPIITTFFRASFSHNISEVE